MLKNTEEKNENEALTLNKKGFSMDNLLTTMMWVIFFVLAAAAIYFLIQRLGA